MAWNKTGENKIFDTALRYLDYRARTSKEMSDHLLKKEFSEDETAECIEKLTEANYLNDVLYAEQYIRDSLEKRRGRYRINNELARRGVSSYDIEDAYYNLQKNEDIDISAIEYENAQSEADRIIGEKPVNEKVLQKISRRFATLGYSNEVAFSVLRSCRSRKNKENEL